MFYNSLYGGMRIKATIVAYAFLVQYFENATIVAYEGLRVKLILYLYVVHCSTICLVAFFIFGTIGLSLFFK